jgi:hypothetical protein
VAAGGGHRSPFLGSCTSAAMPVPGMKVARTHVYNPRAVLSDPSIQA